MVKVFFLLWFFSFYSSLSRTMEHTLVPGFLSIDLRIYLLIIDSSIVLSFQVWSQYLHQTSTGDFLALAPACQNGARSSRYRGPMNHLPLNMITTRENWCTCEEWMIASRCINEWHWFGSLFKIQAWI